MYDPRAHAIACPAALEPVDTRQFAGGRFTVYIKAAGDITVEEACASEADNCLPAEEWTPVMCTDACGDESVSEVVLTVTEEDLANGGVCYYNMNCTNQFIRFSADVVVVGKAQSNRPAVNYGCGPTIVS